MYEVEGIHMRATLAFIMVLLMAAPAIPAMPAGASLSDGGNGAAQRSVTDDAKSLVIPAGETYDLWGCHT
jgi:hypothetical protein